MAVKTDRLEARLSPDERALIERAASTSGVSVSAFMVGAAVVRADEVIAAATTTLVPADYFDALLAALDEPDRAPRLAKAAKRARRKARITAR
ncbi:MAG: DUF1778 domain-containing protein [Acidimicrobiia bacterium]